MFYFISVTKSKASTQDPYNGLNYLPQSFNFSA